MGFFNLFGGNSTSTSLIEEYLEKGAVVIDVRTAPEFYEGHVEGSKNIPLDAVQSRLAEIKKIGKPVIACCRSGARSGTAANFLKQNGIDAINGGPWQDVAACKK
ncbi:MAG: rhodanese-like domain-containing protein [Flavobacteriaceae bacterium]|nr:rhodanese-like domain-containing protein [Flavobacteriaceae bacterium]